MFDLCLTIRRWSFTNLYTICNYCQWVKPKYPRHASYQLHVHSMCGIYICHIHVYSRYELYPLCSNGHQIFVCGCLKVVGVNCNLLLWVFPVWNTHRYFLTSWMRNNNTKRNKKSIDFKFEINNYFISIKSLKEWFLPFHICNSFPKHTNFCLWFRVSDFEFTKVNRDIPEINIQYFFHWSHFNFLYMLWSISSICRIQTVARKWKKGSTFHSDSAFSRILQIA